MRERGSRLSGFLNLRKGSSKAEEASGTENTDKELHKLRRVDLLELLLEQIRENEEQGAKVAELSDLTERLKNKLDQKDEQIERLKLKLDQKDAQIAELEQRCETLSQFDGTARM